MTCVFYLLSFIFWNANFVTIATSSIEAFVIAKPISFNLLTNHPSHHYPTGPLDLPLLLLLQVRLLKPFDHQSNLSLSFYQNLLLSIQHCFLFSFWLSSSQFQSQVFEALRLVSFLVTISSLTLYAVEAFLIAIWFLAYTPHRHHHLILPPLLFFLEEDFYQNWYDLLFAFSRHQTNHHHLQDSNQINLWVLTLKFVFNLLGNFQDLFGILHIDAKVLDIFHFRQDLHS